MYDQALCYIHRSDWTAQCPTTVDNLQQQSRGIQGLRHAPDVQIHKQAMDTQPSTYIPNENMEQSEQSNERRTRLEGHSINI